MYTEYNIL